MLTVVCYDIIDDKQRTKLAKQLGNFGVRVQYSVFECNLNAAQLEKMLQIALKFIDPEKDSLRIYQLCQACAREIISYGIKRGWEDSDVIVT